MKTHLLRWISQLSNLIISASVLLSDKEVSRAALLDLADRMEYLAKNIRERAPAE